MKIYAHKANSLTKAFLMVTELTDTKLVEVFDCESADIVLLLGMSDLRSLYNTEQLFCVMKDPNQHTPLNQPENVCVLDTLALFSGESGIMNLIKLIDKRKQANTAAKPPEVKLPEFSDIAVCNKSYTVLVIDDTEHNLRIAKAVLAGHSVAVSSSLQDAMIKIGQCRFNAVLTDMEMPPDKHYQALNLQRYGIGEKVPYGFAVVFEMTKRGMPVAVVTDGNHHEGWVSAMFDSMEGASVNGQKVLFFNNIGKRWDKALKSLMEE